MSEVQKTKTSRLSDDKITRLANRAGNIIETAILALERTNSLEAGYVAGVLQIAADEIYEIESRYEEKEE